MKTARILSIAFFCLFSGKLAAQTQVEMADNMRAEGKIYVVVAIILVIFAGIAIYLFSIDRKLSRLEKKIPSKKG